jgi:hypothetical protein
MLLPWEFRLNIYGRVSPFSGYFLQTMLSAVVQRLHLIQDMTPDRRLPTIDLCASAYPDVRPWQVKKECLLHSEGTALTASISKDLKEELDDLYYTYLSLLLHPFDGHDTARHDPSLVQVSLPLASLEKSCLY